MTPLACVCYHCWQIQTNITLFIGLLMHTALKCSVNFHMLSNLSKFIGGISDLLESLSGDPF